MSGGPGQQTLWVFAYGSLMWQPGFPFVEARRARLEGYHRSFCIYSLHYRGTQQRPGLVLGLARGGTCEGIAFRVADEDAPAVRAYLHARELIYGVYREARLPADLVGDGDPQRVDVLTYIAEMGHPSFAGDACRWIGERRSFGRRAEGPAAISSYFVATLRKLRELGIRQPDLERLAVRSGVGGPYAAASGPLALEGRCRAFSMRRGAKCSLVRNDRRHAFAYRRRLPS